MNSSEKTVQPLVKLAACGLAACCLGTALAGCSTTLSAKEDAAATQTAAQAVGEDVQTAGGTAENGTALDARTVIDATDMFSDRDLSGDYDDTQAVHIELLGDGIAADATGKVRIDGTTLTITDEGTYVLSGSLDDGRVVVEADDTDKVQIVLAGAAIFNTNGCALHVAQADKVFVTLASGSSNSLDASGTYEGADSNVDATVFSQDDLTFNGEGDLAVGSAEGHGIVSKDDLAFASGNLTVQAAGHAASGKDSVRVARATLSLTAGRNAVNADNDEDADLGFVYIEDGSILAQAGNDAVNATGSVWIAGGTHSLAAVDDGVHADGALLVTAGAVDIAQSTEGLEGQAVTLEGGWVSIVSSDDGINATRGSSTDTAGAMDATPHDPMGSDSACLVAILDGSLTIVAGGDGIDSNGDVAVAGDATYISASNTGADSALDYAGSATITGGTFVATGSNAMAQNFGNGSTQGAALVTLAETQPEGSAVVLTDADGAELVRFAPSQAYSSVLVSCAGMAEGTAYTLSTGETQSSVEMTSLLVGQGSMQGGNGFGGGAPNRGGTPGFAGGAAEQGGAPGQGEATEPRDPASQGSAPTDAPQEQPQGDAFL